MEDIPGLNEIPDASKRARPAKRAAPSEAPQASVQPSAQGSTQGSTQGAAQGATGAPATSSFEFNHPTIIALSYLAAPFFGITGLIALILAYVWRSEQHAEWETSHYTYHIRTFWMWLGSLVVGIILTVVVIGIFLIIAGFAQAIVRAILSLINAQKQQPMPNPESWLV